MIQGFQPLSNYVLIQPKETPNQTPSGLMLPESSQERPNQGTIKAVGDGQVDERGGRIPLSVEIGNTVLFQKYSGIELKLNGIKYLIMRETELLGVLTNAD